MRYLDRHADGVICENIDNGEFDYLLRFPESVGDPYYYCFKNEGCHIIYHRFLPEDYADFDFNNTRLINQTGL